jgi:uncharacterized RDD family membrane protein YckC
MSTPSAAPAPPPLPTLTFGGYAAQPGALEGVPFWPRVGARVVDLIVHYVANFGAQVIFGLMLFIVAGMKGTPVHTLVVKAEGLKVLTFVAALLGQVAYHTICEGVHGSTLGKLALGMVVVQEDGTPCRLRPALIRSMGYFVDSLVFGLVAYLAMQKSAQEQRHGDQWAHTVVVKRAQVAPEYLRSSGRFVAVLLLAMMADAALLMAGYAIKMVL